MKFGSWKKNEMKGFGPIYVNNDLNNIEQTIYGYKDNYKEILSKFNISGFESTLNNLYNLIEYLDNMENTLANIMETMYGSDLETRFKKLYLRLTNLISEI